MTGTILRTPVTDAYGEGKEEGREEGRGEGIRQAVILLNKVIHNEHTAVQMVAEQYGIAIEEVQKILMM